jgi:hypothetical protein
MSPERRAAFPPEGKWVREKVTSDFVRNFVMPLESRIVHAPPDRLEKALQEAIHSVIHPLVKP